MAEHDVELLSALKDGELSEQDASRLLGTISSDAGLRQRWHRYHVIGDALRNNHLPTTFSHDLASRISAALQDEPTILSPTSLQTRAKKAREKTFVGYAVAASVAVVGFLTVGLIQQRLGVDESMQVADAPTALVVPTNSLQQAGTVSVPLAVPMVAPTSVAAATANAAVDADPAAEEALRSYMMSHDQATTNILRPAVVPNVRVVTFSAEQP